MRFSATLPTRLLARLLVSFLAALLMLQGVSVSMLAAKGPAHLHRPTYAVVVLEDVRRVVGVARPIKDGWFGHSHSVSQRHHHAARDPSLVLLEPEPSNGTASDDAKLALDFAVAAFVAMPTGVFLWASPAVRQGRFLGALWQPSFAGTRLIDRPPRLS